MTARPSRRVRVVATLAAGYLAWYRLGLTYGSTAAERRMPMPGDDLVRSPHVVATHAATIPAPPERIWPWLLQVGWHRGGWYTPRWVDVLLFPDNLPSADEILEDHQTLRVGDFVPDGPPKTECGFVVRDVDPCRHLLLESSTHLPSRGGAGERRTYGGRGASSSVRSTAGARPASCSGGEAGPDPGGSPRERTC